MDQTHFTVLNLAIALVVPFASAWFSVRVAQRHGEKETRKRDARAVFLRINRHTQEYKLAMLRFHRASFEPVSIPRHKAKNIIANDFFATHTELNGDILLLHFIFGTTAQPLVDSLHDMMTMYEAFDFENVPDLEAFNQRSSELIHRAADDMNNLWKTL